ncbi:MAG: alpha/beta hydrolase [Polyangiales bacterium]
MVCNVTWKNLTAITSLSLSMVACAPDAQQHDEASEALQSTPAAQQSGAADVACSPADRTPAPTNVPTSAIRRYPGGIAAAKGPYKPVLETDPGLPDYTIYRPEKLGALPHPVLVWGNGGCSRDGTYFSKFLLEAASHGFVVVADGRPNGTGTRGLAPDGTPLVKGLDWILKENERPCSQYYHKLAATKAAVAGQSCGGLMALGASSDKRWSTVIVFNSGLFQRDQKIYGGLHAPMAYFIGGSSDVAYPQAEADTKAISTVPLFYGNLDVGHFATWGEDNAGEFGRVGIQWLKWQLMDDPAAGKVFSGSDCELCRPPSKWKVSKKNLP